ncbi:MAG: hypothetical protein ABI912_06500 [Actinomycetota bacterium]
MEEATARAVVDKLRARGGFAHVHPVGVYEYSVRMVLRDGREAIWDADGAAGLEAVVMRDGVLVGLVETIPDSENFDVDGIVRAIANTDYDAPLLPHRAEHARPAAQQAAPAPHAAASPAKPRSSLLRRLTGK